MTIKEKVLRIMELALAINPPELVKIGKKKTAVFVDWSPHCNVINIRIHKGGWNKGVSSDRDITCYTCPEYEHFDTPMDKAIEVLESILDEEREQNV